MTVKMAAARLGVSMATVYALCAHRQIRFSRVGLGRGKIVISEEGVAEYLLAREVAPQIGAPRVAQAGAKDRNGADGFIFLPPRRS